MNVFNFARKVIKRLALLLHEILREHIYTSEYTKARQNISTHKSHEDQRFVALNKKYWCAIDFTESNDIILVEGFFAASGHNYLMRTGMLAKAIQEKLNLKIAVLFDKASYKLTIEKEKYESFGIRDFFYIKPSIRALFNYCGAIKLAFKYYISLKCVDDILSLNHDGVLLGDLIYDDLLKTGKNKYTIDKIEPIFFRRLIEALYYYYSYDDLFKKYPIKYLIVSHLVYAQYGILARIALRFNVDVIETNDLMVNYLSSKEYINKTVSPTYHSVLKKKIQEYLNGDQNRAALVACAEQELHKRITGAVDQFDARFAYRDKVQLSKHEFQQRLGISANKIRPMVVIFTHVFADAPHSSEDLLFRDYYHWITETLKFAHTVQDIDWIIKPHPASKVYNEEGVVEMLVENVQRQSEHKNLYIYPEGITAANLYDIANAIVTVQGTAGIEFSCLGLPVVLAGKAFFAGEGFTYDPTTREEYFTLLAMLGKIPKLSADQIFHAKEVYAAFSLVMAAQSKIIPSSALDAIWGYGENKHPNIDLGNKIINDFLEKHDPKNELQYNRLQQYLS